MNGLAPSKNIECIDMAMSHFHTQDLAYFVYIGRLQNILKRNKRFVYIGRLQKILKRNNIFCLPPTEEGLQESLF